MSDSDTLAAMHTQQIADNSAAVQKLTERQVPVDPQVLILARLDALIAMILPDDTDPRIAFEVTYEQRVGEYFTTLLAEATKPKLHLL